MAVVGTIGGFLVLLSHGFLDPGELDFGKIFVATEDEKAFPLSFQNRLVGVRNELAAGDGCRLIRRRSIGNL